MVRRGADHVSTPGKGPPPKRQKKKKTVPDEILKVLNVVYAKEWQNSFVRGFVIEEPVVGSEEGLEEEFFNKLEQVQLLNFFQKTCAVIAPRELIANFILDCKVEKVSSKEKKITYELPFRSKRTLQLTETRFAHILQLPTSEAELTEQSSDFFDQINWLGNRHISGSETYWSISEIKDPAMKDLYKYLSKWIFRLTSNIKISRSQILPVCEALDGNPVDWTQYLWPKFVSSIEKMKESAKHNKACKCNIAGLVSAILFEHTNELGGIWTQAWDAWGETETPEKVRAWNAVINRLPGTSQPKGVDSSRVSSEKEKKKFKAEMRQPRKKTALAAESMQTLGQRVVVEVAPKDKDVQDSATTLVTLGQIGRPPYLLTDVLGKGTVADFVNFHFAKSHEQLAGIGSAETQEMINHFIAQGLPVPKVPSFNPEGVRDIRLDDLLALRQTKPVEDGIFFQSGPVQRMIDQLAENASVTSDVLRDLSRFNGYLDYQLSIERKKFHDIEVKYSELDKRNKELQAAADKSMNSQSTISQLQHEFQKSRERMSLAEREHENRRHLWNLREEELENQLADHLAREEQWSRERKAYEEKIKMQQKDLEASIISEATTADRMADLRSKLDRALTKLSQQEYQKEYQKHALGFEDTADQEMKKKAEKASLDIVATVLEATNREIAQWSESLEKRQVAHGLKKSEEVDEETDEEDEKNEQGSQNGVKNINLRSAHDTREEILNSSSHKVDAHEELAHGQNRHSPEHTQAEDEEPEPKTGSSEEGSSRCTFRSTTRSNTSR